MSFRLLLSAFAALLFVANATVVDLDSSNYDSAMSDTSVIHCASTPRHLSRASARQNAQLLRRSRPRARS
jgi:hypothetical protein